MFPLVAIGGAIGAAISIAKGVSWLADQLDGTGSSASAGGKGEVKPQGEAKSSAFEAALSAQIAGQKAPPVASLPVGAPLANGPDHDMLARMQAGLLAYGHVGERRPDQPEQKQGVVEDRPVVRS